MVLNNKIAAENEQFLENFQDVLKLKKWAKNKKFETLRKRKQLGQQQTAQTKSESQTEKLYSLIENRWVTQVETNQLAANHPIEDRLRVSTFKLNSTNEKLKAESIKDDDCDAILFAVFDGHGGGFCADVISRRLFHYLAIGLKALFIRTFSPLEKNVFLSTGVADLLKQILSDHSKSPSQIYLNIYTMYEEQVARRLQARIEEFEFEALKRFAWEEIERSTAESREANLVSDEEVKSLLLRAFTRCDEDLSREIESNLIDTTSNVLLHYYHSLAVSGCCAALILVYQNKIYMASVGDCRAVLGLVKSDQFQANKQFRMVELSREHNSDNASELVRIYSEHPKEEHNFIIREHRLLGQLMPLRAFGDFSFKWSVEKMKYLGLTRAFGSHVIPTFYRTPPYLSVEPEITIFNLEQDGELWLDRFIIMATDGLWEQFDSPRKVVKAVNRYRRNWSKQIVTYASAKVFHIDENSNQERKLTLKQIANRLREQVKEEAATIFQPVTADDDLIEDINCSTFLLRTALSDISIQAPNRPNTGRSGEMETEIREELEQRDEEKFSHHVDQYEQQRRRHSKLVSYLTLPQSVVRNFRDDISVIVIGLK